MKEELVVELNGIFKQRIGIDFTKKTELKNTSLFGDVLRIPVREVVIIFLIVENKFNVTLSQEEILDGKFNTFNNILKLIDKEF